MATKKQATIVIKAPFGNTGKIVLPGCPTVVAAETFLTAIMSAYMDGVAVSVSASETKKIDATIPEEGNTDRRAVITYQDNNTSTVKRISIPSWGTDAGDSELESGGERVPLVACQSVVEALQTASGGSLTALSGYVIQGR